MIAELQDLQNQARERAVYVGRVMQSMHHIAAESPYLAAVPWYAGTRGDYIHIVIGKNGIGADIHVAVPIGIFETAGDADLRIWAHAQNAEFQRRQVTDADVQAANLRAQEIASMRTLMQKYPEEVNVQS